MRKRILAFSLLTFCPPLSRGQDSKPAPKTAYSPIPVTELRRTNPVKPTEESIERGKKIYAYDCAGCHGVSGDGRTDAGKTMKIPDLTDPAALKDRPDGELYYVIKSGRGDMPLEGDRVKPEETWDLVNYVRSLTKGSASETKPTK
jgi:mono/diheme cytochrome c family protein